MTVNREIAEECTILRGLVGSAVHSHASSWVSGSRLLTTGSLSLPMREPARSFLLDVRRGNVTKEECLTRAGELERELEALATTSALPDEPEEQKVEDWVIAAYRRRWRTHGPV